VPADGDSAASEFEDLADLFERAAADRTPIREIVGDDPVEFVEAFAQNYTKGGYVPDRARKQQPDAITRAEGEAGGRAGEPPRARMDTARWRQQRPMA
jgi:DNA-binding ferritin-like protein (Dps family)